MRLSIDMPNLEFSLVHICMHCASAIEALRLLNNLCCANERKKMRSNAHAGASECV